MVVWINGEARELADDARVLDALGTLGLPQTGVAVAVNGEVVPAGAWPNRMLGADDAVEIVRPFGGG